VVSAAEPPGPLISGFSRPQPLLFLLNRSSFMPTGLSGPRSRLTATQKIWQCWETNLGPLGLKPGTLATRPQRRSNMQNSFSMCCLLGQRLFTSLENESRYCWGSPAGVTGQRTGRPGNLSLIHCRRKRLLYPP
jgi:hypothetical protein